MGYYPILFQREFYYVTQLALNVMSLLSQPQARVSVPDLLWNILRGAGGD